MADLTYLIYSSTPFGFEDEDLHGILQTARHNNARDQISGALVYRHDVYLQYLEGPAAAIDALYLKIRADDRHVDVILRAKGVTEERLFADWEMLHDPSQLLMWSVPEVDAGAMEEASPEAYLVTFKNLSAKARAA